MKEMYKEHYKFSIKDFFSKCDHILMENFIFGVVAVIRKLVSK